VAATGRDLRGAREHRQRAIELRAQLRDDRAAQERADFAASSRPDHDQAGAALLGDLRERAGIGERIGYS
jgi:hypothetical protein